MNECDREIFRMALAHTAGDTNFSQTLDVRVWENFHDKDSDGVVKTEEIEKSLP